MTFIYSEIIFKLRQFNKLHLILEREQMKGQQHFVSYSISAQIKTIIDNLSEDIWF